MSAISGTRRAMKEMADGTIRVQIDIDPACRAQFLALFPNIDVPVALAPLVADFEQRELGPVEKPKGGELAKLAGMLCQKPEFWEFMTGKIGRKVTSADEAADAVRRICSIASRAELDSSELAATHFHRYIRLPYMRWKQGVTA
jgi:hypothetical protein